jgi:hypothetical protein
VRYKAAFGTRRASSRSSQLEAAFEALNWKEGKMQKQAWSILRGSADSHGATASEWGLSEADSFTPAG